MMMWEDCDMNILLVDDHPVFRSGMAVMTRNLFTDAHIIEVGDQAALTRYIEGEEPPDLVLLDLLFPGFDAARDFPALRRKLPLTPIVAVSMVHDNDLIDEIMAAGANGFVSKTARPEDISAAFLSVMDGETVIVRASGPTANTPGEDAMSALTARQLDVLRYVAKGMSNKEIARELNISPYTVRIHVSGILKTLELTSRSAAASYAASRGFT